MNHFRLFSGRSTFHATKNSNAVFHFGLHDQTLSCLGLKFDTVDGLGKSYYEYFESHEIKDAVI